MSELPGYAKVTGIIGLILAIVSLPIPIIGFSVIVPFASLFGIIALIGNNKKMGLAIIIIAAIKLIISPSFWTLLAGGIGGMSEDVVTGSLIVLWWLIYPVGILVMIILYAKKDKRQNSISSQNPTPTSQTPPQNPGQPTV